MKLASIKHGRDGRLVVVSRDLGRCVAVPGIAPTLQDALDRWEQVAPRLAEIAAALDNGELSGSLPFVAADCAAPLPRAYLFADGSAFLSHVELVRRARGADMPAELYQTPLMYQGDSGGWLAPTAPIPWRDAAWGLDFEGEVAAITGDLPAGCDERTAATGIRLLMLVNDVSLRGLIPAELARGFGFYQSKPASSASPVAVTPDELGDAWHDGRVQLPLEVTLNGKPFGHPHAGAMHFSFPQLIAHAARTRPLVAGSIIGSGTVSNADASAGEACIAERRMREHQTDGTPHTPWLMPGDKVRFDMRGSDGQSVFGAIEQQVTAC